MAISKDEEMSMGSTDDHDAELPFGHPGRKFDDTPSHYDRFDDAPTHQDRFDDRYEPPPVDPAGEGIVHYGPGESPLCGEESALAVHTEDPAQDAGLPGLPRAGRRRPERLQRLRRPLPPLQSNNHRPRRSRLAASGPEALPPLWPTRLVMIRRHRTTPSHALVKSARSSTGYSTLLYPVNYLLPVRWTVAQTLALMRLPGPNPFQDALSDVPSTLFRSGPAALLAPEPELACSYRRFSLGDVFIGFAGYRSTGHPTVMAIVRWDRERSEPQFQANHRAGSWEVVVPELVFQPDR